MLPPSKFPEVSTITIPRQSDRRKTLLPTVLATRIPTWPRFPLRTAINFSGSVVAIAITTTSCDEINLGI